MPKNFITAFLFLLPVFAFSQTADFTFQGTSTALCTPATVSFTQNCTGNPTGFLWDFGNNVQGVGPNVSVTYTNAGYYTVTLTAIYELTSITISKQVTINPEVIPIIGFDRNYICTPGPITFTGNSSGNIANYSWDFGDSSGLINVSSPVTTHPFSSFGNYSITLVATDISGCIGQASSTIKVQKPSFVAVANPLRGCIPADVNFNASVNVPVNDFVTNYTWNFDDGSAALSGGASNVNHQYGAVGIHYPTLSITTNNGCADTFSFPPLGYGTPPTNLIAFPLKSVVCGSETPVFIAKAVNANLYSWDFGDGTSATFTDTIAQHKYNSLGIKTVTVTPLYFGCAGTPLSFKITVVGVIARYSFRNTCIDRKTYSFTNTSIGKLGGILWDFGDNSSTVTTKNTSHTFPSSGKFLTKLTVTDTISGCVDTYSQNIYTADPILVNPDSSICKNATTAFSITNNYTNPASTYTWNVVGTKVGSNKNPALSIKAATLGNFTNFVSINYGSPNCPDTVRLNHLITVKGPDLSFTLPSTSCFNTLFSITNNSKPFLPADSVPLWYWNYGYIAANDSIYQPIPFIYGGTGTFTVKLVGIDINGCKDSLKKTTVVNPIPFLQVVPAIDTLCQGSATILRAFSNNNIAWSPTNNLSCTNCDSVVANPAITTKYYVTATTPANCTSIDSVLVKVFNPITATAQPNPFYICQNESVQLDVNPKGYTINWSPATGLSSTTIYNPTATPLQTNVYTATLTDSVGCFTSSVAISVVIKSLPTVNAGPDQTVSHNASFTLAPSYSANVREYSWTPSNLLSCNVCAIPKGIALNTQTYTIQASSDSGCIATDSVTIFVECKNANILMPKAFTPNNDNLNDVYYPITRGIKTIRKFAIFNREGKLIYEAQNFPPNIKSFGWTGLYKGQIQSSTGYVYILEAICESGEILTKNGSFLLMR